MCNPKLKLGVKKPTSLYRPLSFYFLHNYTIICIYFILLNIKNINRFLPCDHARQLLRNQLIVKVIQEETTRSTFFFKYCTAAFNQGTSLKYIALIKAPVIYSIYLMKHSESMLKHHKQILLLNFKQIYFRK